MTLNEALKALGRTAWLPRVHGLTADGRGFTILAQHASGGALVHEDGTFSRLLPVSAEFLATCRPDIDDYATIGVLLLALREASGDDMASVAPWDLATRAGWRVWYTRGLAVGETAATEGEAIAAALIALAGAL